MTLAMGAIRLSRWIRRTAVDAITGRRPRFAVNARCGLACACGIDPDPLTLRELLRAARAARRSVSTRARATPGRDSGSLQACLTWISAACAAMISMKNHWLAIDPSAGAGRSSSPLARPLVAPTAARNPITTLSAALQILAARMREAVAERRESPPGSERYRRADERVAYLNELYVRLQRRMEVPLEIWLLDGGWAPLRDRRTRRGGPR